MFFIYRLFIDIYSEYYSVRLLSKLSGHHCAYFAFLSKHMARVDCRGPTNYCPGLPGDCPETARSRNLLPGVVSLLPGINDMTVECH